MKAFAADLKTIYFAPSEEAGRAALDEVSKKWNQPICGWGSVYNEFCIMYEGRMPE